MANHRTGLEIAVIGMSGRFPKADNINEFWKNLEEGKECISHFSDEELIESGTDEKNLNNDRFIKSKGYIKNVDHFDFQFFDYSPKDALTMDPQIRTFMECAYEALEVAGYAPETYKGSVGVYGGAVMNMHNMLKLVGSQNQNITEQFQNLLLNDSSYLCTSVSYKFNLTGPSLTVQTACSTSLVAIHLACQALLAGECNIALAGGVNINYPTKNGYLYSEGMINSPDGKCRAFDENANGTIFSDGAGIVALKPLEDAIEDGDTIHAIIKGTATNNDGTYKVGFSAPGLNGQAKVIKSALQVAEVEPESISYIETHGTGTNLGDPIEIAALKKAFNSGKKGFCRIGSVKANIGHLYSAAGVASFIKTVEALKRRKLPPLVNFSSPNPKIDFENSPFRINDSLTAWEPNGHPLRAGVSSFGIGGTNAHAILEESVLVPESDPQSELNIISLSAKTQTALDKMTENLIGHISNNPEQNISDVAFTLHAGRAAFPYRKSFVCSTNTDALSILKEATSNTINTGWKSEEENQVVFMFPGQGSQYINMGLELYNKNNEFRKELNHCFSIINNNLTIDIESLIFPDKKEITSIDEERINQTEITQLLLFSFEYALAKTLMFYGVRPDSMIGHSIGEYVAACLSGVFSIEDAIKIVSLRGALMQETEKGTMISISIAEEELAKFIPENIDLAAVNSSSCCVVSGSFKAIEDFEETLIIKKVSHTKLKTSHAFHSRQMEPMLNEFKSFLENIKLNTPRIPFISNVTGNWITVEDATAPEYWVKHLRGTVKFSDGLDILLKDNTVLVEAGPGRSLSTFIIQHKSYNNSISAINLIKHPKQTYSDNAYFLNGLSKIWSKGVDLNWQKLYNGQKRARIVLPTYPFDKQHLPYYSALNSNISVNNSTDADKIAASLEKSFHLEVKRNVGDTYEAPTNKTEQQLVQIWQELFGLQNIGISDSFYDLGGDSLKAVSCISKIHQELNVILNVATLFENPEIRNLAKIIEDSDCKEYLPLVKIPTEDHYNLSPSQQRLFIINQLHKDEIGYNLSMAFDIKGSLDIERLNNAFNKLILRHESLRTGFELRNNIPSQIIYQKADFNLEKVECSKNKLIETTNNFVKSFDLSKPPLMRAKLVTDSKDKQLLLFDIHHIIADGLSLDILFKELWSLYTENELPELNIQYKDFSAWQNNLNKSGLLEDQYKYWEEKLAGNLPSLDIVTDYPRPVVQSFEGSNYICNLPKDISAKLYEFANENNVTTYMVLLAVLNITLSKYSGQQEIMIGSPVGGRKDSELDNLIGMFVNILVMRNQPLNELTFKEFLSNVKTTAVEAFENQDCQFEEIIERLNLKRDLSRNPLFDVLLVQRSEDEFIDAGNLRIEQSDEQKKKNSRYDITLFAIDKKNYFSFEFEYCTTLYKKETITRLADHFIKILNTVLNTPGAIIESISCLTPEEESIIIHDFNNTFKDYPLNGTLHSLFEEQVEALPDNEALVFEEKSLSYKQLNNHSNQLANYLHQNGAKPDQMIGICMDRSLELVFAYLGVIKSGAAYIPIDPGYPSERIKYMIEDSGMDTVITQNKYNDLFKDRDITIVNLDTEYDFLKNYSTENPDISISSNNSIYAIYTSGSTGNPKAAINSHKALRNRILWMQDEYKLDSSDSVLQKTPISFDVSGWEFFWPLITGARLVMAVPEGHKDCEYLVKTIKEYNITTMHFVPSMLNLFLEESDVSSCNNSLRRVICSGEALQINTKDRFLRLLKDVDLHNLYGPTEAAIDVTAWNCKSSGHKHIIPIGKAISNTQIYILDKNMKPVPIGIKGELYIGGVNVAKGYLNKSELTNEKFIENPFNADKDSKLYRTGDLARFLDDGNIEYLGRIDDQVKVNGLRIELGEIEAAINNYKDVKESAVLVKSIKNNNYIIAYIVSDADINQADIKSFIGEKLPDYMVPSYFIYLDSLPLSPNGKLNRSALPEVNTEVVQITTEYIAPSNDIEKEICQIVEETLGVERIGVHDNFFDLGANSLQIIQLNKQIKEKLGINIPVVSLFKHTSTKELSSFLSGNEGFADTFKHVSDRAKRKKAARKPRKSIKL